MTRYIERLYQMRQDIIRDILECVRCIKEKTGSDKISWGHLTNEDNPDLFFIDAEEYRVPEYISFKENSNDVFVVTFQGLPQDYVSENGSGLYIEHLVDILDYLTAYLNEL